MKMTRHRGSCAVPLLIALLVRPADAAEDLRPPCAGAPTPSYPAAMAPARVQSQSVTGWTPPICLGWIGAAPTLLVAIAGRIHEPGGADALLARFGAVAQTRGVRYWSVTDKAWRTLIQDAFAVTDATGTRSRGDFRPEELQPGIPLHLAQNDTRSSGFVIYRMTVIARTASRVVVTVVNVSPVRTSLVTLFRPGELQATYFLDRLGPDEWGYFGLWGITTGVLTGGHAASSINRAVALYRNFAGIPSDAEPPAAR